MDQSSSLQSAQVQFLDTKLSLIHIPLHLYGCFVQPILHLILPIKERSGQSDQPTWASEYPFVNVSVTPVECSVACSAEIARKLFVPIRDTLAPESKAQVTISDEQYVVVQVDGEGLEAGQRVLELSSPLAMNGISIFFITTYFSDYILVPLQSRSAVIKALETRGFIFSAQSESFVNLSSPMVRPHSSHAGHNRQSSSQSSFDRSPDSYFKGTADPLGISSPQSSSTSPQLPPTVAAPSSVAELEARTFNLLQTRAIVAKVDTSIKLVQCSGRKDTLRGGTGVHASAASVALRFQLGLVKSVISSPCPRFFSLTLTDTEPASLLLEKTLLANFEEATRKEGTREGRPASEHHGESDTSGIGGDRAVLLGNKEDVLIPITLDLRELPMDSTGIVCGIAGRLVGGTSSARGQVRDFMELEGGEEASDAGEGVGEAEKSMTAEDHAVEMSYLSTARAGTVMVSETELGRALEALKLEGEDSKKSGE